MCNQGREGRLRNLLVSGGGAGQKGGAFNVQGSWRPCPYYQMYDGLVSFKESLIKGPLSPWYHFINETNFVTFGLVVYNIGKLSVKKRT